MGYLRYIWRVCGRFLDLKAGWDVTGYLAFLIVLGAVLLWALGFISFKDAQGVSISVASLEGVLALFGVVMGARLLTAPYLIYKDQAKEIATYRKPVHVETEQDRTDKQRLFEFVEADFLPALNALNRLMACIADETVRLCPDRFLGSLARSGVHSLGRLERDNSWDLIRNRDWRAAHSFAEQDALSERDVSNYRETVTNLDAVAAPALIEAGATSADLKGVAREWLAAHRKLMTKVEQMSKTGPFEAFKKEWGRPLFPKEPPTTGKLRQIADE